MLRLVLVILLVSILIQVPPAGAEDAAARFSATANPSGNWSYGWASPPGTAFTPDATVQNGPQTLSRWLGLNGAALGRHCNGTNLYLPGLALPGMFQPGGGGITAWPGSGGEAAVLRWTAPAAGTYRVNATFTGLAGYPSWPSLNAFNGPSGSERFGQSVASAGDVNGDGFDDVVVGHPFHTTADNKGRVVVYFGAWNGLTGGTWSYTGSTSSYLVGSNVAGGDLNGDGYSDVAVGAPGGGGRVYVFYGSPTGLPTTPSATLAASLGGTESLCTGDFNADGLEDLAAGYPGIDMVRYWLGSAGGVSGNGASITGATGSRFGQAVAGAGDVDGDGFDDLVVGASLHTSDLAQEGKLFLYRGSAGGPLGASAWQPEGNQSAARFGQSVALADVDGDGFDDVVAGAYVFDSATMGMDAGQARVYLGGAAGPSSSAAWTHDGGSAGALFGFSVARAGDVERDGYDDIVVGEPGQTGRALVFRGSASGPGASPSPAGPPSSWRASASSRRREDRRSTTSPSIP